MATEVDLVTQLEVGKQQIEHQKEMEQLRIAGAKDLEKMRVKLECMRMAHASISDNKRSLPVEQRSITPQEIVDFATVIENSITSNTP